MCRSISDTILSCLFQRVLELEATEEVHKFIYIDEVGFNLYKTRRRGRNIISQHAIVNVPGQRGGNITLCAGFAIPGDTSPAAWPGRI